MNTIIDLNAPTIVENGKFDRIIFLGHPVVFLIDKPKNNTDSPNIPGRPGSPVTRASKTPTPNGFSGTGESPK